MAGATTRRKEAVQAEYTAVVKQIRFPPMVKGEDPIAHLEERRELYIERLELIADEARAGGMPELELKALAFLIRLTSAYKTKVDVTATNLGLIKPPDLSGKSDEELAFIEGDPKHKEKLN